jgi:5'-nucleotidase
VWSVVQIHSSRPYFFIVTLILLTNDDGYEAEGLSVLEECLKGLGEIVVVAPDQERSAVSHSLTLRSPLVLNKIGDRRFTLNGTPADCIIYGLSKALDAIPDLVVSGINHGANLGDDIMYSGTVAAAREASRRGIPSLAISQAYDDSPVRFNRGKKFIRTLACTMLEQKFNGGICLNVNIPMRRIRGVRITRQGCALNFPHFNYYSWDADAAAASAVLAQAEGDPQLMLDFEAIAHHFISVTPLQRDQTDYRMTDLLGKKAPQLFRRFWLPGMGLIGR